MSIAVDHSGYVVGVSWLYVSMANNRCWSSFCWSSVVTDASDAPVIGGLQWCRRYIVVRMLLPV
jgi:hypothetical protein